MMPTDPGMALTGVLVMYDGCIEERTYSLWEDSRRPISAVIFRSIFKLLQPCEDASRQVTGSLAVRYQRLRNSSENSRWRA